MDGTTGRALATWSLAVALFGLGLAGAGLAATDGFTGWTFGLLGHADPVFTPELRFAVALMGAVTLGWGLSLWAVATLNDRLDPATARILWRRIAIGVLAWFAVDSALSVATGFALNAASNTVLLVAFLAILLRGGVVAVR